MKTTRRTFLKTGAMAIAGAALLREDAFSLPPKKSKRIVGLQLYSIREDMGKDPMGSLKQVAAQGWKYVEHANYRDRKFHGWTATEFKKILDDLGLNMVSGHTAFGRQHWDEAKKDFSDSWKWTVEDAAILGQQYVTSPSMDNSMRTKYDDFMHYMDIFNKCGDLCKKSGMKFAYHNHDFEFSEKLNEKKLFDIMMTTLDPKQVVIQLDMGNLYNGGAVAMDVVKQYPKRFENVHVKDEIKVTRNGKEMYESTILGDGIVNVQNVLEALTKTGGTRVYIVEHEAYQGKAPLDCVKADLDIMAKWGYKS
jgi:sugar phosphate isomerase/epimerase